MVLGHNGHAIRTDQLSCRWFIGSCQVEQVVHVVAGPTFTHQVIILSLADHLAAMGDRLHVILILMARLIQGILGEEKWLINQQNTAFTETVFFDGNIVGTVFTLLPTHTVFVMSCTIGLIIMKSAIVEVAAHANYPTLYSKQTTIAVARDAKCMTPCEAEIFPGKDPPDTYYSELQMGTGS